MVTNEDVPADSDAAGRIRRNSVTCAETAPSGAAGRVRDNARRHSVTGAGTATVVVISSSPAAPSLSRGFSLSFQHQQNSESTQGVVPSARLKRTNSLDFERLVPFNREASQHFPAEKRSPSPRSKQNSRESSLALHA